MRLESIYTADDTSSMFIWETLDGVLKTAKGTRNSEIYFKSPIGSIKDISMTRKDNKVYFTGSDKQYIYVFDKKGNEILKYQLDGNVVAIDLKLLMNYDKFFLSYRDEATKVCYLIDNSGKICQGFPIKGFGEFKSTSSSNIEVVFKSDENSFSLYKID